MISWIKSCNDNNNFKLAKAFGFDVYEIDNVEEIDNKLKELIDNNYSTIVISNELSSFSQDVITKYKNMNNINIIISHK